MDEKLIIKKIEYLWFFSGIIYILPALIIFNYFISSVVTEIPEAMQQQDPLFVLSMTFISIIPFFAFLIFGGFSFRNWYLLKKEKHREINESKLFAFLSLIIFGIGLGYFLWDKIKFSSPFGIGSILFSILITLILLSSKSDVKDLVK